MLALGVALASCSTGSEETAVSRGDIAFARDSLEEAIAEYRLAVRQGDEDPQTLARVAHTYVRMGRVEEARDFYRRAAERDDRLADQAAADFARMARAAAERGDRFQMASAMDAALSFRPGLSIPELTLPLARHHFESGEFGRALPFYQKALAARADSSPELVYEIGQAHEQTGNCERALVYFERYRSMIERWQRDEVEWYIGNCAFRLARDKRLAARELERRRGDRGAADRRELDGADRREGRRRPTDILDRSDTLSAPADSLGARPDRSELTADPTRAPAPAADRFAASPDSAGARAPQSREALLEDALRLVNRTLRVGQPRNLLGQAWFERGEILAALGECEAALDSFERVPLAEPSSNTAIARRSRDRYDEIRFGQGLRDLTSSRGCG